MIRELQLHLQEMKTNQQDQLVLELNKLHLQEMKMNQQEKLVLVPNKLLNLKVKVSVTIYTLVIQMIMFIVLE